MNPYESGPFGADPMPPLPDATPAELRWWADASDFHDRYVAAVCMRYCAAVKERAALRLGKVIPLTKQEATDRLRKDMTAEWSDEIGWYYFPATPPSPGAREALEAALDKQLDELMMGAENYFGAINAKRVGHIRCAKESILAALPAFLSRPTTNNADHWALWLSEYNDYGIPYIAVQIAEAIDAALASETER